LTVKTAIILAAGEGTKIVPYQETRQKAALPVANVPAVRRLAADLQALGFSRFVVVVGHRKEQVRHALAGVEGVVFVEQPRLEGTAPAVLLALHYVEDEPYLVVYGDIVLARENLQQLIERFGSTGAEAAALVQPLERERSLDWICARVSEDRLQRVMGHPRRGEHRLCGVYAFRSSATDYLARNPGVIRDVNVGGMPPMEADVAASLDVMLDEGREVLAVPTVDFFVDMDKPWHILHANRRASEYMFRHIETDSIHPTARVSEKANIQGRIILGEGSEIGDRVEILGPVIVGKNSRIIRGAMVEHAVVIGDRCVLRDYCLVGGAVIGAHSAVGHAAEFSGVMFDRVILAHYCEISAVIGSATDIGAATVCGTIRFDDDAPTIDVKGREERPRLGCSFIGDYCRTGVGSMLMPGSRIGPYSCVGPGVVVYNDVPPRTMVLAKQETITKPWGPEKYGW